MAQDPTRSSVSDAHMAMSNTLAASGYPFFNLNGQHFPLPIDLLTGES